ncbi:phosphate transport system regulatory protein PhoU [Halobacteriales archaeon QH_7_65_31]|nr:MAG: phosphate transport system regulatory protein PhoU [Halobacteriales archaeon QH_7_65_31]
MAREGYQAKLGELQEDVLYMSELVLEQLRTGLSALDEKDEELAWEVIEGDGEINQRYLGLESNCIDLVSLQQPVAGDLRFIAASFKIITDLERIGDLATNLGEYTLDAEQDRYPDVDIQAIGSDVIEMVETAMAAYADDDTERSFEVAARDDEIDELCERASTTVVRDLIETEMTVDAGEDEIEALMADVSRFLLTVRDLERVGDHAVNIAGRTLYMVESDDELIY